MKPGCFYSILYLILLMTALSVFAGCQRPVGKCRYGETPAETGVVKIRSIEKLNYRNKPQYRVRVEGFFTRDFIYDADEYDRCFKTAGYKAGSVLKGSILGGGPCPPVYSIESCRTN